MTSDNVNNNQLTKVVGYTFPILITILFLYVAFKGVNLNESFSIIAKSSILPLLLYIIVFFLSHLARAIRWKFIVNSVKNDVSMFHLFGSVMVSYGVSCVVPRLGELYRGLFLGRWEGISRSTIIGTIVVERIIDIAAFAFAALISVSIFQVNLYDKIIWLKTSLIIGFLLIFCLTIFLIFLVKFQEIFRNGLIKISKKFSDKTANRVRSIFDTLLSGLSSIKGTKNIFFIVVWTILLLLLYALNSYVGFYILGMDSSGSVTFKMAWIVMTISSFGVMIPTPGGTGPYHAISILVLTQLFLFSNEISAAYAILTHFINYVLFILTTLLFIFIVNRQREKKGLKKETFLSVFNLNTEEK